MDDTEITNIIHAGVVFAVYLFIAIVVYYTLSGPIGSILDGIGSSAIGTPAETQMTGFMPYLTSAVLMAFALGLAFPVTWFVFWVFSREPDLSRIRLR